MPTDGRTDGHVPTSRAPLIVWNSKMMLMAYLYFFFSITDLFHQTIQIRRLFLISTGSSWFVLKKILNFIIIVANNLTI